MIKSIKYPAAGKSIKEDPIKTTVYYPSYDEQKAQAETGGNTLTKDLAKEVDRSILTKVALVETENGRYFIYGLTDHKLYPIDKDMYDYADKLGTWIMNYDNSKQLYERISYLTERM